jgi:hypothetical protein
MWSAAFKIRSKLISINTAEPMAILISHRDLKRTKMPLDPRHFYRKKKSEAANTIFFAVEWSAIILIGLLAVLFLSWGLALHSPLRNALIEHTNDMSGGNRPPFTFKF